ncbi:unnamed protein product [Protopolystoma xenopodis]|uniref:Uncharacterized protein n=1 Tax=Protopolystoma xenopodis TaxID=117903 RepID=A0A3S4ZE11_9PLAT|nr:unnamed protein product [Protopolystoma xenopodis]
MHTKTFCIQLKEKFTLPGVEHLTIQVEKECFRNHLQGLGLNVDTLLRYQKRAPALYCTLGEVKPEKNIHNSGDNYNIQEPAHGHHHSQEQEH